MMTFTFLSTFCIVMSLIDRIVLCFILFVHMSVTFLNLPLANNLCIWCIQSIPTWTPLGCQIWRDVRVGGLGLIWGLETYNLSKNNNFLFLTPEHQLFWLILFPKTFKIILFNFNNNFLFQLYQCYKVGM